MNEIDKRAAELQAIYNEGAGGVAFNGQPLPTWEQLIERGQQRQIEGWRALARRDLGRG